MNTIANSQLNIFLNKCSVCYDEYDHYDNNAILNNTDGSIIASIDYETNKTFCESSFYLNTNELVSITESQTTVIFEFIDSKTLEQRNSKALAKEEKYDVSTKQDLYAY